MKIPSSRSPAEKSMSKKEQKSEQKRGRGTNEKSEERSENMKTAPDVDEKLQKLPDFLLTEIRTLEGVSYYHGMMARDIVETKLARCGDYLVRSTDNRISEFEFVLSVFNKKRIHSHMTIRGDQEAKKWYLGLLPENRFPSIIDLVNYFKINPLGAGLYLTRAISKGKHLISHDRITYCPKEDLLGSGNFSDVFRGKMELENVCVKVALKNSKKLNEMLDPAMNKEASKIKKEMIQEAEVMSQLRHTNITAFFGMSTDRLPILIVIEFCNGGNLEGHLKKYNSAISYAERMLYVHDASAGLKYIHSMSITHRDIAARNCLISANGFVKLSDFGMGLKIGQTPAMSSECFPNRWMAPETILKRTHFSKMTDVWSLGILTWEIYTNATKPFFELENEEVNAALKAGKHPKTPDDIGKLIPLLLKETFKMEPHDRITGEIFHKKVHEHCEQEISLTLNGLTLNQIQGVKRERLYHWDQYVPQVVICDKNGSERGWGDAPPEMLANVVWRGEK
ncbi:unnamed protein product [Caenorhabditis brenneri]